ncbi:glycosyltransferase family 4 protein [Micromonospora soli]|uniref:glycosyltransferase family 4 protein n=1 Tax=Micromonospora sp. NBRC 110009 TaxID=3061627 RepID=UPI002672FD6B|nr:glycosyltransferase family 4 protein [Micromonospora sp. NBRC 110009]WKT99794.1 glycosyltransferase family 4 protein [Micromonospora sp. NBRC 110009]
MKRVLVVSVEPPWPAQHGGRIRTARVAEALGRHLDVLVTFPDHGERQLDAPVATAPLPWSPPSAVRTRASGRPHLGGHYLVPVADSLLALCDEFRPDAVYWSHSYLAAWAPPSARPVPQVVEFANIESRRLQTLVTSAHGWQRMARRAEATKAAFWEPRVAARAALCVALSQPDVDVLRGWARDVVLVPNGVDLQPYTPSPADGYALALASYDYEPNVLALRALVRDTWPLVRAALPTARLVVAGRRSEALSQEFAGTPGVTVLGTLDDVADAYAGAALTVAPATTGGGSQLKLTESMSRGRSVVMSPFAAQGLPSAVRGADAYWVADEPRAFADAVVDGLRDRSARQAREHAAWRRCAALGWPQAVGELVTAISTLAEGKVAS